ncbi:hypothetical protein ACFE04_005238 [Oxalis oulophora]
MGMGRFVGQFGLDASIDGHHHHHLELYAALNCYMDYAGITLEELNFFCYCNESALIMSSELSDKPGKTIVTCKKYDQTAYGCNMWEWFDNDVLRKNWIADMTERNHFRLVNNSTTNVPLSMPCILLAPSIGNPGRSRFYYVCTSYYEPNGEKCCMKLLYGETKESNWPAKMVLKLKTTLDKEVEAHNETKSVNEHLEEEVSVLRMEILELKEKKKKRL